MSFRFVHLVKGNSGVRVESKAALRRLVMRELRVSVGFVLSCEERELFDFLYQHGWNTSHADWN